VDADTEQRMPLQAVERLTPSPRTRVAFDFSRHGEMDWMILVDQPKQMLERAERAENFGEIAGGLFRGFDAAQSAETLLH
jgi:hypothetical protein